MPRPIRVGVIGGGIWGRHHLTAVQQLRGPGGFEHAGVATRRVETGQAVAAEYGIDAYTDYRRMLDEADVTAVTVATPDHLHREMVLEALDRGLHVLVEKPMDTTVEGAVDMAKSARDKGLLLQVDFHKRFDPYVIDARQRLNAGGVGSPQYGYAYMEDQIVVPLEWLHDWAARSSPFWFLGTHKFDLLRWLTGREAVSVRAHGARGILDAAGISTYDSVAADIEFDGGFSATIHTSWVLPRTFDSMVNQGLRIVGSNGVLELDTKNRGLRYCLGDDGISSPNPLSLQRTHGPHGPRATGYFIDGITDFLQNVRFLEEGGAIADLEGSYPDGTDGVRATELAEAVAKSLENGTVVRVESHQI